MDEEDIHSETCELWTSILGFSPPGPLLRIFNLDQGNVGGQPQHCFWVLTNDLMVVQHAFPSLEPGYQPITYPHWVVSGHPTTKIRSNQDLLLVTYKTSDTK